MYAAEVSEGLIQDGMLKAGLLIAEGVGRREAPTEGMGFRCAANRAPVVTHVPRLRKMRRSSTQLNLACRSKLRIECPCLPARTGY